MVQIIGYSMPTGGISGLYMDGCVKELQMIFNTLTGRSSGQVPFLSHLLVWINCIVLYGNSMRYDHEGCAELQADTEKHH